MKKLFILGNRFLENYHVLVIVSKRYSSLHLIISSWETKHSTGMSAFT